MLRDYEEPAPKGPARNTQRRASNLARCKPQLTESDSCKAGEAEN